MFMGRSSFPASINTRRMAADQASLGGRSEIEGERSATGPGRSPGNELAELAGLAAGERDGAPGLVTHDDLEVPSLPGLDLPDLRHVDQVPPVRPEERTAQLPLEIAERTIDDQPRVGGPGEDDRLLGLEPEDLGRIEEDHPCPAARGDARGRPFIARGSRFGPRQPIADLLEEPEEFVAGRSAAPQSLPGPL